MSTCTELELIQFIYLSEAFGLLDLKVAQKDVKAERLS